MITSIFINALGQAIFESCGQALLIYVALQMGMHFFPGITSKYKYDINYLGLTIIICWFLANLVNIYLHNAAMAKYNALMYSGSMTYGAKHLPTLLQQAEGFITTYAKYITGLYMIGLLLHAFKLLGGFVHIHHIRKQKNLTQDNTWAAKTLQLCKQLEVVRKVSLYFSAHIQIPLTIGYFKPIIIFPIALVNNLDSEQVEAILLHELAHIKRHDYLLNILQCIMETILCFNPFVWLISKTIRQEREYCCDDIVMDAEYNNFTYSKALYIIAQQNSQNYALAMASAGSKKYPLLNRIKRLNMKTNDSLPKFHLLIIVAVAAMGGLLAWGIPQYSIAKTKAHYTKKTVIAPIDKYAPSAAIAIDKQKLLTKSTHKKNRFAVYSDTAENTNFSDTLKTYAKKFKIVISDNGVQKEYNSVEEMPEAMRKEFFEENPSFGSFAFKLNDSLKFASMEKFKMSPEFKKEMLEVKLNSEKMRKQFNSPQWKKEVAEMKINAEKMQKEFRNSPEWKKQMEDMKVNAEKIQEEMKNNPEWKKQMEDIKVQAEKIGEEMKNNPGWKKQVLEMKISAEKMSKQFNSPQWKRQMKEIQEQAEKMGEQFNSPEWKKQMKDMQQKINMGVKEQAKGEKEKQEAEEDSLKAASELKLKFEVMLSLSKHKRKGPSCFDKLNMTPILYLSNTPGLKPIAIVA